MNWIDTKYINLVCSKLRNFKKKSGTLYNFSCPICNDSAANKFKARGYIYEKSGKGVFHCHNCNVTLSLPAFIKKIDPIAYDQYLLESIKENKSPQQVAVEEFVNKMKPPKFISNTPLKNLKKISQLSPEHPAKKFIVDRMIPNVYHSKLFYCPKFKHFINTVIPDKFDDDSLKRDGNRILIPYINRDGGFYAANFRALDDSSVKYLKIVIDQEIPNVYGLDCVDLNRTTYVFEGEFDSMFVKNSLATGGGDLSNAVGVFPRENLVICYDNERRSHETIGKIDKAITQGFKVFLWPSDIQQKDINQLVIDGVDLSHICTIIDQNTFSGLSARVALAQWRRV